MVSIQPYLPCNGHSGQHCSSGSKQVYMSQYICFYSLQNARKKKATKKDNIQNTMIRNESTVLSNNWLVTKKDSFCNQEKVAKCVAWYINPIMYIMFSLLYFMIGSLY